MPSSSTLGFGIPKPVRPVGCVAVGRSLSLVLFLNQDSPQPVEEVRPEGPNPQMVMELAGLSVTLMVLPWDLVIAKRDIAHVMLFFSIGTGSSEVRKALFLFQSRRSIQLVI